MDRHLVRSHLLSEGIEKYRSWLFVIAPLFIVAGNFNIWLEGSSLTIPIIVFFAAPIFIFRLYRFKSSLVSRDSGVLLILMLVLMLAGGIGWLSNEQLSASRFAAHLIPYLSAVLIIYSLSGVSADEKVTVSLNRAALILSCLVMAKLVYVFIDGLVGRGDFRFYELKAQISLPLGGSNYLSAILVFLLPFSVGKNNFVTIITMLGILATMSRFGVFFCFLVLFVMLTVPRINIKITLLFSLLLSAAVVPTLYFLLGGVDNSFAYRFGGSILTRVELWDWAISYVNQCPFIGCGAGGFRTYLAGTPWDRYESGAHNSILYLLGDFGVLGLVAYVLFICFVLRKIFQSYASGRSSLKERVAVSFVALIPFSFFDNIIGVSTTEVLISYFALIVVSPAAHTNLT